MRVICLLLLSLLVPAITEAQLSIHPGLYEYTIESDLALAPILDAAGYRNNKKQECLTPADVKGDLSHLVNREMEDLDCKLSDVKTVGTRMTFTTTCEEDGLRMVMRNEMTVTGDGFTTVTRTTDVAGKVTTMKITGRRLGECAK